MNQLKPTIDKRWMAVAIHTVTMAIETHDFHKNSKNQFFFNPVCTKYGLHSSENWFRLAKIA